MRPIPEIAARWTEGMIHEKPDSPGKDRRSRRTPDIVSTAALGLVQRLIGSTDHALRRFIMTKLSNANGAGYQSQVLVGGTVDNRSRA
jgi:hypothetical protein